MLFIIINYGLSPLLHKICLSVYDYYYYYYFDKESQLNEFFFWKLYQLH